MRKNRQYAFGFLLLLAMTLLPTLSASAQTNGFANSDFQAAWQRTDFIVGTPGAHGYYWGPVATSKIKDETYNGKTLHVQYFDKARMELNEAAAPGDKFRVTTGLLANELISGNHQTGDTSFQTRWPAAIAIAGDVDDANAPTYASFHNLTGKANSNIAGSVVSTIARNGTTGADNSKASDPGAVISYYEPTTGHNIPKAFWDFLNAKGPTMVKGKVVQNQTFSDPWNYITGYPTTEAYWAKVKIAGQANVDVLIQAYERRVITYVPSAPPAYRVQMGNIGQHYYDWLYNNAGKPANVPTPPPSSSPTPKPAPGPDCSGIPADQSATVTPNCLSAGQTVHIDFFGFTPGEAISLWFTDPDNVVVGTPNPEGAAPPDGHLRLSLPIPADFTPGIWALTVEGATSHHQSIGWFKIVTQGGGQAPTPTPAPSGDVCNQVPAPQNGSVSPKCGSPGTTFTFNGTGFTPGQEVRLWLTGPDQQVYSSSQFSGSGQEIQLFASNSGTVGVQLSAGSGIPSGLWALTFHQLDGHHDSILYIGIK